MKTSDLPFIARLRRATSEAGQARAALGTETVTALRREQSDRDRPFSPVDNALGTETATRTRGETTDRDPQSWF